MTAPGTLAEPAGRREQNKAHNREAILAAAREVFAELGYGAATVRDIVRRTDLASGTFYNYFPDKEAVFRALVDRGVGQARVRVRAARARARNPEQFVGDAFREYFESMASDPATAELMRRNAGTIARMSDDPALGPGVAELLADLRAAIERGELPPLDADYLAGAMAGVGLEVGARMLERDPMDVEGAARFATELFVGGIERLARTAA